MNALGRNTFAENSRRALWRRRLEALALVGVVAAWWAVPAVTAKVPELGAAPDRPLEALASSEVAAEVERRPGR